MVVVFSNFESHCHFLQRIHLDIQVGEHANDYQEIAAKDKLTELQLRIRQLLDQVEQISKEQNYQRVSDGEQIRILRCHNLKGCGSNYFGGGPPAKHHWIFSFG